MNDDDIIRQRIAGKSVRAIAKTQRRSAAEINAVIDRWTSVALTAEARKHGLALELARLDELISARAKVMLQAASWSRRLLPAAVSCSGYTRHRPPS